MLYEEKELSEINYLKHIHDSEVDSLSYENKILTKSLSPYLFLNDVMNGFLIRLQPLVSLFFDQMNIVKNFKNYMVDKYDHNNK